MIILVLIIEFYCTKYWADKEKSSVLIQYSQYLNKLFVFHPTSNFNTINKIVPGIPNIPTKIEVTKLIPI